MKFEYVTLLSFDVPQGKTSLHRSYTTDFPEKHPKFFGCSVSYKGTDLGIIQKLRHKKWMSNGHLFPTKHLAAMELYTNYFINQL